MKKILFAAVLCVSAFAVNAQVNFTGNWTADIENIEYVSGNHYFNGSPGKLVIKQLNDNVTLELFGIDAERQIISTGRTEVLTIGGKVTESASSDGSIRKTTIQWGSDKSSLIRVNEMFGTDKKTLQKRITDTWKIEDGKLILQRHDENFTNGDVWEQKVTYERG